MMQAVLYGGCAATYAVLVALILLRPPLSRTGLWLAAVAAATAAWAAVSAGFSEASPSRVPEVLDVLQSAVWYGFALHLFNRSVAHGARLGRTLAGFGSVALLISLLVGLLGSSSGTVSLFSTGIALRLGLAICKLLLVENLYRNAPEELRWNVGLPCIALAALSLYEIGVCADAVLVHQLSETLYAGRAVAAATVVPLLAIAAARNRDWAVEIHVSRAAVFHSATLLIGGIFLLALAGVGELLRHLAPGWNAGWGAVAEISLLFAGVVALLVLLTAGSARARLRALLVDHFFSHRYDYRREWQRCIDLLSATGTSAALSGRVIRALAAIVDSPGGVLFLHEPGETGFRWAGSWNMPALAAPVLPDDALLAELIRGDGIAELPACADGVDATLGLADAWLAAALFHDGEMLGFAVLSRPRGPFRVDREVCELVRIVGREAAARVAEQHAVQSLLQTRQLHEYGKRFAFVAHDIKNVSSQLSLMLANAEHHIGNPEFQLDMLVTVRASLQRIGSLLRRLQGPGGEPQHTVMSATEQVEAIVASYRRSHGAPIAFAHDGRAAAVAMDATAFDTVIRHLLDNAVEAAGSAAEVAVTVRHEAHGLRIDVADRGPGMTPRFVRDELFRPFHTSKQSGSGIGAFQARELLREAGGDLLVQSTPGAGTTMQLLLPLVEPAHTQAAE